MPDEAIEHGVIVALTVNGEHRTLAVNPADTLLYVVRERLRLTGAKNGCGRGECGACTMLVGGKPVASCLILAVRVKVPVETIEGMTSESAAVRAAFADCGAFQCGFCTPGQIVRAVALLRQGLPPGDAELRHALSGNLCRCTGYQGIITALRIAAGSSQGAPTP